ncbi:serine/threonine-protein kinase [Actinoallomurus sp. NPDC050550]|uniref:WD40 repeat domain-containing serine/threonine protein kinase n=1 Tax=Actinoallomurus sp. NPDC050550 TaxID=3154937 RepID=UPI0033DFE8D4
MGEVAGSLVNDRYRLLEMIGQGSMGTVWRAHDETLDREVAVKEVLLPPELDDQERAELSALAMDEARSTARLRHPGVITIFDVIEHDGAPMIVMELIEGRSLAEILREEVRLPPERVAEIGAAVLAALREAHAAGIVHRDLKPANVLITDQRVVVTDFGIARRIGEITIAEPGEMSGTPAFVSPEQAQNAAASPAADLWSLGATLYNALEGHPPYQGGDYASVLLALLTQEPEPPRSAGPLTPLIVSLLQKDPARRATAEDAAAALDRVLNPEETPAASFLPPAPAAPAAPPSPPPVPRKVTGSAAGRPKRPARAATTAARPVARPTARPAARSGAGTRPSGRAALGLLALLPVVGALVYACNAGGAPVSGASGPGGLPGSAPAGPPWGTAGPPGGVPSASYAAGSKDVGPLAFSPGGKILAVGEVDGRTASDGAVELLDRTTHRLLMTFTGTDDPVTLAFSPDGRSLAVGGADGTVGLWSIAHRKQTATVQFPLRSSIDNVEALEFSHDGRTLFSATDNGQYGIWRLGSEKQTVRSISGDDSRCVDFSPGGASVACDIGSGPGLWNVARHRKLGDLPGVSDGAVADPVFSPDGKTLAASEETFTGSAPGAVDLWDAATRNKVGTLTLPSVQTDSVTLEFSPDSRTLATSAGGSAILLWDVASRRQVATLDPGDSDLVSALAFSGDGRLLAAGGLHRTIDLWDLRTHRLVTRVPTR